MYYEEKLINGSLYYRTSSHEEFFPIPSEQLTTLMLRYKRALTDIMNWDESMEDEYEDQGDRARCALYGG
jgi:hypothetical protein